MKKIALLTVVLVALLVAAGVAKAEDMAAANTTVATEMAVPEVSAPVSVGNKICPVTGEEVKELGANTVEFEGKVYNLCCPACKEEFLKDTPKYIAKVDEELAMAKDATLAETK